MRKAIFAPLCSAFVIPGLGQIINKELKKGICMLLSVFFLFIIGTVKLSLLISAMLKDPKANPASQNAIVEQLQSHGLSGLRYIILAFGLLWIYSVLDAFWKGRKLDQFERRDP
jgi:TM2 domain-containing membrane protein YozV